MLVVGMVVVTTRIEVAPVMECTQSMYLVSTMSLLTVVGKTVVTVMSLESLQGMVRIGRSRLGTCPQIHVADLGSHRGWRACCCIDDTQLSTVIPLPPVKR